MSARTWTVVSLALTPIFAGLAVICLVQGRATKAYIGLVGASGLFAVISIAVNLFKMQSERQGALDETLIPVSRILQWCERMERQGAASTRETGVAWATLMVEDESMVEDWFRELIRHAGVARGDCQEQAKSSYLYFRDAIDRADTMVRPARVPVERGALGNQELANSGALLLKSAITQLSLIKKASAPERPEGKNARHKKGTLERK